MKTQTILQVETVTKIIDKTLEHNLLAGAFLAGLIAVVSALVFMFKLNQKMNEKIIKGNQDSSDKILKLYKESSEQMTKVIDRNSDVLGEVKKKVESFDSSRSEFLRQIVQETKALIQEEAERASEVTTERTIIKLRELLAAHHINSLEVQNELLNEVRKEFKDLLSQITKRQA